MNIPAYGLDVVLAIKKMSLRLHYVVNDYIAKEREMSTGMHIVKGKTHSITISNC